jgi:anthranilate synthase/aminodeoxychorismate synthase-like glutamine amidotransferase
MWILIDNYDSFTHILQHYLLELHPEVRVFRNDAITISEIQQLNPERIIISPGPQRPSDAGISNKVIQEFHRTIPILGVCLGHQALGEYFGASLVMAARPVHGKTSPVAHRHSGLFEHIPSGFDAMRYHSLVITDMEGTGLVPLAFSPDNEVMALKHQLYPCTGIQFHPESVLTQYGKQLLRNWKNNIHEEL